MADLPGVLDLAQVMRALMENIDDKFRIQTEVAAQTAANQVRTMIDKIDAQGEKLESKIDSQAIEYKELLKNQAEKMDAQAEKLDSQAVKLDSLSTEVGKTLMEVQQNVSKLEERFETLSLETTNNRIAVERELQQLKSDVETGIREVKAELKEEFFAFARNAEPLNMTALNMSTTGMVTGVTGINQPNATITTTTLGMTASGTITERNEDSHLLSGITRSTCKPGYYDGQSSWMAYRTQFEVIAKINAWTEEQKAGSLVASLRQPVTEILQALPEDQRLQYGKLVEAIERRYGEGDRQPLYVVQLKMRTQGLNET